MEEATTVSPFPGPPPASTGLSPPGLSPRRQQLRSAAAARPAAARDPAARRRLAADEEWPTPDNYVAANRLAPPCLRRDRCCAHGCERCGGCQWLGRLGLRLFARRRAIVMPCTAFITFALMMLLILPLLGLSDDDVFLESLRWGAGTAHWDLVVPAAWSDQYSLGLTGVVMASRRAGRLGFTRYDTAACQDVFGDACGACASAGGAACALLVASIVLAGLCMYADLQRSFHCYDLNWLKAVALLLHAVGGVVLTVLPLVLFSRGCYDQLPIHAVDKTRDVGLEFVWEKSFSYYLLIALIVLRPLPAFLHLLTPTPEWASGRKGTVGWFAGRLLNRGRTEDPSSGDDAEDPEQPRGPGPEHWHNVCAHASDPQPAQGPGRPPPSLLQPLACCLDEAEAATEPVVGTALREGLSGGGAVVTGEPVLPARPPQ
eukprot:EG_transcript_7600